MTAIWKFPLSVDGLVELPAGSEALTVQTVRGEAVLYAIVYPDAPMVGRRFPVYGTGHPLPVDPGRYLGTFQLEGGALVFHVFDPTPRSNRSES